MTGQLLAVLRRRFPLAAQYVEAAARAGEEGRVVSHSLTDYVIPTIRDKPEIAELVCVEDEYKYSAFGAKGVGEIALISTPLAIANAVSDAIGVRCYDLPLNAEKVHFAQGGKTGHGRGD